MFLDIAALAKGRAFCGMHAQVCDVPKRCDVFVCGFSCKDFSILSRTPGRYFRFSILFGTLPGRVVFCVFGLQNADFPEQRPQLQQVVLCSGFGVPQEDTH